MQIVIAPVLLSLVCFGPRSPRLSRCFPFWWSSLRASSSFWLHCSCSLIDDSSFHFHSNATFFFLRALFFFYLQMLFSFFCYFNIIISFFIAFFFSFAHIWTQFIWLFLQFYSWLTAISLIVSKPFPNE